jgi:para-aminobenzoate synthetase component 1
LPQNAEDDLSLPDIYFTFYKTLLVYDRQDPAHLYACVIDGTRDDVSRKIRKVAALEHDPHENRTQRTIASKLISNISRQNYINSVNKVLDYIRAGDIYQACLSQRFKTEWPERPYELYLRLNEINPAPFSAFLNYNDFSIISSSPELLLDVRNGIIETRPMKGTRPRGMNADEDKILMEHLRTSTKDASELSMIVDLERNDLGKVSVPGSVRVSEHRRIETYPTVFQTISVVKSEKEKNAGLADVMKAVFPGGSISGCPKIRAMEIIDELEPNVRSVYTGSIGYMSFHDTMEFNVAIRTMILKDKDVYFYAGGGIVADSDPEAEYEETLHKAKAMIEALGVTGDA